MPRQDLPLDLVVLADLALAEGHAALGRRHRLEPDGFAAFLAGAKPSIALAGGARLEITELRDFRPESLAARLPDAAALLDLRKRVSQQGLEQRDLGALIGGLPEGSPLRAALEAASAGSAGAEPPAAHPAPAATPAPAGPAPPRMTAGSAGDAGSLDALFEMVDAGGTAPAAEPAPRAAPASTRALDRLVSLLGAGPGTRASSATQASLARVLDDAIGETIRGLLHDPAFRALEQTWLGLRFLVRRVDLRAGIRLHVLATTRARLERDLRGVFGPFADEQRREARVVVALADFDLAGDAAGLELAAALARVAAEHRTPLVAGADPRLLGLETFARLAEVDDLEARLGPGANAEWSTLRAGEDARWLALTANRFLLRLPYGAEGDRVKGFAFEENPAEAAPGFLWARGPWAIGERIAASFARTGWGVEVTGQDEDSVVADLPVRLATLGSGEVVSSPVEALLPERRALELAQAGLIALLARRGGDAAFVASAPVVHRAANATDLRGAEARRDSLPFAMLAAQVAAWIAHLESRGRFASEDERRATIAQGVQFLSRTGEGPVLEAKVEGDRVRFTPWRDPLRGLPDLEITLEAAR